MATIKIELISFYHRNADCIGIFFQKDDDVLNQLKTLGNVRWSRTKRCWYIPASFENYLALKKLFSGQIFTDQTLWGSKDKIPVNGTAQNVYLPLEQLATFEKYRKHLTLKGYSPNTMRTYLNEFRQFLIAIKNHDADHFTPERLKDYLFYCHDKLKLSENTLHSRINALKFYYEKVLRKDKFFWNIPRPKKPLLLPKLLNEEELQRLFNALKSKKHKAILFTVYSSGLRVSEVVNLKLKDIDGNRLQMRVSRAKGKKDRYVNLSPVLLDLLRQYIKTEVPRPKEFLFESKQTGTSYPTRTIQQIFSNAKRKAMISKDVGIHSLRHSFATHLLEKGTDIKYIKDLLGHFDIKTTERYLHVSRKKMVNIVSPFDDLWNRKGIDF